MGNTALIKFGLKMSVYHLDLQYGVSGLIESNWIGTAYGLPSATPADLDF